MYERKIQVRKKEAVSNNQDYLLHLSIPDDLKVTAHIKRIRDCCFIQRIGGICFQHSQVVASALNRWPSRGGRSKHTTGERNLKVEFWEEGSGRHLFSGMRKDRSHGEIIGVPLGSSVSEAIVPYSGFLSYGSRKSRHNSVVDWMNKFGRKAEKCTQGIREHVKLGSKITETVKSKLSLGARIVQAGGVGRVFRHLFGVEEGEKLLKSCQCCLSTSAGPIAGLLFISTEKIAFHSGRSLTLTSPQGEVTRIPYKVLIPVRKIKSVAPAENVDKPKHKYMRIVTVDGFEFWFMGFVNYRRCFKQLEEMAVLQRPLRF